ncbi:SLAIN motif-containing 1-like isoform X3 [Chlorella sorokiniana]|uniref:SLAIN motif-containing 1-like isoform X3 n=1 Tax=Chlorella sorokiniana TaxID=3076 RepID=A0A2P6TZ77_CHLSO|nr:SLAIN motif-containing 1-like isoform X3 [Chlorella sorokiniana]|eukprot:PRW59365.1 SLAIN motif-containing 1-like isoform X3 [Chlorella sorokiniana]
MAFELPCPHCGSMVAAPQLQPHIKAEHADRGSSGGGGGDSAAAAARPGPPKPAPVLGPDGKPKVNPPRKQMAAFAALRDAVKAANKSVIAARKANMPDASRLPPSQAAAQKGKK